MRNIRSCSRFSEGGPPPPLLTRRTALKLGAFAAAGAFAADSRALPDWALGPFVRPEGVNPVLKPSPDSVFYCPMRKAIVQWEHVSAFNPAAAVKDGKVYLLYRAEDPTGPTEIGGHTSRLGLAESDDGLHFRRFPAPVLYPANDARKAIEWDGGIEDPRLICAPDGTFVAFHTVWDRKVARLCTSRSRDLFSWTKQGPVFAGAGQPDLWSKSGAVVCRPQPDGRLQAVQINGRFWMYWGDTDLRAASSTDLVNWDPGPVVLRHRPGYFDSSLVEAGSPPVVTERGIVAIVNGRNDPRNGDPALPKGIYTCGQVLFDANDPAKVLSRTDKPFYRPEAPFEKTGQYAEGTTFINGLVFFKRKWFLYYGCADSFTGVAVHDPTRT